jgi:very-short-patch-repair endonuclease
VISHASAGAIWGFLPPYEGDVHVTIPGRQIRSRPGLRGHTTKLLHAVDVRRRHNLPVTAPARALLEIAPELALRDLERAVDETIVQDLVDQAALQAVLARYPHYPGAARLRAIIAEEAPLSESEAERRFRALVAQARLIQPRGKVRILGYTVDFAWLDRRLIIEIDGYRYHRSRRKFESDRERDATLQAAGYTVVRFTWRQLRDEPAVVLFRLGQLLGR